MPCIRVALVGDGIRIDNPVASGTNPGARDPGVASPNGHYISVLGHYEKHHAADRMTKRIWLRHRHDDLSHDAPTRIEFSRGRELARNWGLNKASGVAKASLIAPSPWRWGGNSRGVSPSMQHDVERRLTRIQRNADCHPNERFHRSQHPRSISTSHFILSKCHFYVISLEFRA